MAKDDLLDRNQMLEGGSPIITWELLDIVELAVLGSDSRHRELHEHCVLCAGNLTFGVWEYLIQFLDDTEQSKYRIVRRIPVFRRNPCIQRPKLCLPQRLSLPVDLHSHSPDFNSCVRSSYGLIVNLLSYKITRTWWSRRKI